MLAKTASRTGAQAALAALIGLIMSSGVQAAPIGEVQVLAGQATITRTGAQATTVTTARLEPLSVGDTVVTTNGSEAIVRAGKSLYHFKNEGSLRIDEASPADEPDLKVSAVSLLRGLVTFFIPKRRDGGEDRFRVSIGTVVAAVKGTVFQISYDAYEPTVSVLKGTVAVKRPIQGQTVACALVSAGDQIIAGGDVHLAKSMVGRAIAMPTSLPGGSNAVSGPVPAAPSPAEAEMVPPMAGAPVQMADPAVGAKPERAKKSDDLGKGSSELAPERVGQRGSFDAAHRLAALTDYLKQAKVKEFAVETEDY